MDKSYLSNKLIAKYTETSKQLNEIKYKTEKNSICKSIII